jgi:enoyl-CoA hydratase/carnithine racemase
MPIDFATKYCEVEELRDGHLLVVRLNRPKGLNSLHTRCHMELARVFDYFDSNDALWVAVLTGNGRAFCAGNDLRVNAGVDTDGDGETLKPYNGQDLAMPESGFGGIVQRRSVKPIIAAVNGVAHGGGFELALSCDIIVASEKADFALPEVRVGLAALAGGILKLPRLIGYQTAMEMILTARRINGADAFKMGIAQRLVPADQNCVDEAIKVADEILLGSPDGVQLSVQVAKAHYYEGYDTFKMLKDQAKYPTFSRMFRSPNTIEGPKAFTEKRKPNWVPPKPLPKSKL